MTISSETAQTIALQALAWLVANEDLLPVFLGSTGASEADIRARAAEPDFLASVLDFIVMDDAWVIAFCDTQGIAYDQVVQAREILSGGGQLHWT